MIDVLESVVPGGLVSHFRSDNGDSVYFNILIPDSIRAEADSDYGGMLACGNSEIGSRRLSSLPSLFRAICMNGCIWDRQDGTAFVKQVHRGEIDLSELRDEIHANLTAQIPLLTGEIDTMLGLREYHTDLPIQEILASAIGTVSQQITKPQADEIRAAYRIEQSDSAVNAFDMLQGFTRAAQTFDAQTQERVERAAGEILLWDGSQWSRSSNASEARR